jgi:hypothetical protein
VLTVAGMTIRRAGALTMALFMSLGGCGSKGTSKERAKDTPAAAAGTSDDLLRYVPTDTAYVAHMSSDMFKVTDTWLTAMLMPDLKGAIIGREALPGATPKERLRSEIARELAPLDASALARIGWDAERSSAVVYGHGLVPVLRASMNGATARAALTRAAKRAGIELESLEANGTPYTIIPPTGEHDVPIAVVFHAHQVVAAMTSELAPVLPHLMSLEPATPSFATDRGAKPRNPSAPASARVFIAAEPERVAGALRAGELRLVSRDPRFTAQCASEIADLIDELPAFTDEMWIEDDVAIHSYTFAKNPLIERLVPADPELPRWIDKPEPPLQVALGISPAPFLTWLEEFSKRNQVRRRACGKDVQTPLELGPHLAALSHVKSLVIAGDVRGKSVHLGAAIDVDDTAPVLAWIGATFFGQPLPELPLDQLVGLVEVNGMKFGLVRSEGAIFAALGSTDRLSQLAKLEGVSSPAGTIARAYMDVELARDIRAGKVDFFGSNMKPVSGPTFDSGVMIDVSVLGDVLVIHQAGSTQMAPTP